MQIHLLEVPATDEAHKKTPIEGFFNWRFCLFVIDLACFHVLELAVIQVLIEAAFS